MSSENCVACGSPQFFITPAGFEKTYLMRCQACGIAYTHPKPSTNELDKHYSQAYYGPDNRKFVSALERIIGRITKWRAHWINKKVGAHSRILDIGCGRGLLLKALSQLGHECHGTERSDMAAARAQGIVGIQICTKPLEQCELRENYFDLAILWHVLEHLEDPLESLIWIFRLLKPGGILIIEVPNLSSFQSRLTGGHWFHLDVERHLIHFTPGGLNMLLERADFQVRKVTTFSLEQCPFGALQSFLNCLGLQPDAFYKLLKREICLPLAKRLLHYSLAGLSVLPASLFALLESLLSRGGVLRIVAQKVHRL